jgi:hypothetical protein
MKIVVIGGSGRVGGGSGYLRAKVAQEAAIEAGTIPYGELTPGDGARIGATELDPWFATQPQGVAR